MISSISGHLSRIGDDRAYLRVGGIEYELLIPSVDVDILRGQIESPITFHTLFFLQGDGNFFEPTLIGFREAADKRFFEKFITVKGIGPRTALRALTTSTSDIASAIERKDARFLTGLKGIGKRTAELIVAELSGKLGGFVVGVPAGQGAVRSTRNTVDEDAINALVALGETRYNAEQLLERVKQANPDIKRPDQLIREMLKLRN